MPARQMWSLSLTSRGEMFPMPKGGEVEVDIEIFAVDRPAVTERVFDAAAHGPAAARIALLVAGANEGTEEEFGRVDFGPRTAAGHVDHRLVPPPKPRQPELAARGHEPTLLRLGNPVLPAGAQESREWHFLRLTLFVGRGAVDFDAPDPRADLIVAAALEAADEAGEVEGVGNVAPDCGRERRGGASGPAVMTELPTVLWVLVPYEVPALAPT